MKLTNLINSTYLHLLKLYILFHFFRISQLLTRSMNSNMHLKHVKTNSGRMNVKMEPKEMKQRPFINMGELVQSERVNNKNHQQLQQLLQNMSEISQINIRSSEFLMGEEESQLAGLGIKIKNQFEAFMQKRIEFNKEMQQLLEQQAQEAQSFHIKELIKRQQCIIKLKEQIRAYKDKMEIYERQNEELKLKNNELVSESLMLNRIARRAILKKTIPLQQNLLGVQPTQIIQYYQFNMSVIKQELNQLKNQLTQLKNSLAEEQMLKQKEYRQRIQLQEKYNKLQRQLDAKETQIYFYLKKERQLEQFKQKMERGNLGGEQLMAGIQKDSSFQVSNMEESYENSQISF